MTSLIIDVPAKVNLFLIYCGVRDDGYAEIITGIQAIDIFDRLIIEPSNSGFEFHCDGLSIKQEDNLAYRAARLFEERFGFPLRVKISLIKHIPVEAGLGGGSADAAFTLKGLARFFKLNNISDRELQVLGSELGSDVPFFFTSGQAIARGRGEIVDEVKFPVDYFLCLIKPPFGVNTRWAYDRLKNSLTSSSYSINLNRLSGDSFFDELLSLGNSFELVVLECYPQYTEIKDILSEKGANIVRLTGSGSVMYGLFRNEKQAKEALELAKSRGYEAYLARPFVFSKLMNENS